MGGDWVTLGGKHVLLGTLVLLGLGLLGESRLLYRGVAFSPNTLLLLATQPLYLMNMILPCSAICHEALTKHRCQSN